jgi:TetR/AcrR family transcriptional regulator
MARVGGKIVELHRSADTRDRILQVAQVLFAEQGYRGTSLRDISSRIGIKAPSLLHHFSSKEQIYLAVLDRIFGKVEDAVGSVLIAKGSYQERIRRAITGLIDFIATNPNYPRILWNEFINADKAIGRQVMKRRIPPVFAMAQNFIFLGQREGAFRAEVDPFHFLLSLSSITLGYFTTATMVKRLWNVNLLEPEAIETRKQEVLDLVARTLFRGDQNTESTARSETEGLARP